RAESQKNKSVTSVPFPCHPCTMTFHFSMEITHVQTHSNHHHVRESAQSGRPLFASHPRRRFCFHRRTDRDGSQNRGTGGRPGGASPSGLAEYVPRLGSRREQPEGRGQDNRLHAGF